MILQRRNRILRQSPAIRSMVAETILKPSDFIAPLFIDEGQNISTEIASMPGYYRRSVDLTVKEVKELWSLGIKCVLLFIKCKDELKDNTGKEAWKNRLGGKFSASPVLVSDQLFAFNETGRSFIYKANPDTFELVGENQLGDEVMATPAICGGRIYIRLAIRQNKDRQEMLYCIGTK